MYAWGGIAKQQLATRPPGAPHATGATEAILHKVRERLNKRASTMPDIERAQKLLDLFLLDFNNQVDEQAWVEKIRLSSSGAAVGLATRDPTMTRRGFGAWLVSSDQTCSCSRRKRMDSRSCSSY